MYVCYAARGSGIPGGQDELPSGTAGTVRTAAPEITTSQNQAQEFVIGGYTPADRTSMRSYSAITTATG